MVSGKDICCSCGKVFIVFWIGILEEGVLMLEFFSKDMNLFFGLRDLRIFIC